MADYISREAALKQLSEAESNGVVPLGHYEQRHSDFEEAKRCIEDISAADVQPVKQGRWIISNLYAQCSECSVAYDLDTFQRLIPMNENVPRHCTYCGSKNGLEGR